MKLERIFRVATIGSLLSFVVALPGLLAASNRSTQAELKAASNLGTETRLLVQLFEEAHYNRGAVNEAGFAEIVQEFMSSLDERRMVFLQNDRDTLTQRIGPTLHWKLSTLGDLGGATAIFDAYRARSEARTKWIVRQLQGELRLDTDEVENLPLAPFSWPKDAREADNMWVKQLKAELIDEILNGRTEADARNLLRARYENELTSIVGTGSREVADRFLATVARRYDAHSTYYGPAEFREFGASMRSDLVGIGLELNTRDGRCVVKSILSGGPAEPSHLSIGDEVLSVGEEGKALIDVSALTLRQVVGLTRGKAGTSVRLITHPVGALDPSIRLTTTLVRGRVPPDAIRARARTFHLGDAAAGKSVIAVVTLGSFYGEITTADGTKTTASRDVAQLLEKLKGSAIGGLVLDLRGNGGGYLGEATGIVGLFVGKGPAFQLRNYSGEISITTTTEKEARFSGPLVVLVDELSASASEIVAGVLKEYGRAIVVGSPTVGMASVQTVLELRNLSPALAQSPDACGAARLTIQRVFTPGGMSAQLVGVTPDVVLPSMVYLAEHERDLLHPLSSDRIAGYNFAAKPIPQKILDLVGAKSAERQRALPDLIAARRDADRFLASRRSPVLLNLDQRRKQIQAERAQLERPVGEPSDPDKITLWESFDLSMGGDLGKSAPTFSAASTGPTSIETDSLLRESLRILRDSIEAGWMR